MVDDDDNHDEVNKTAEEIAKRGSVLNAVGEDDEGEIMDEDSRRNDGMSEANLPKSNCRYSNCNFLS